MRRSRRSARGRDTGAGGHPCSATTGSPTTGSATTGSGPAGPARPRGHDVRKQVDARRQPGEVRKVSRDPADVAGRQRPQQRLGVEVMLSGQDLRRGHQSHLIAILDGQDRCLESNDGLPGPHVALQEAIHGPGRTHVVHHLFQHPLLRAGGMEGQNAANRGAGAVLGLKLDSL